MKKTFTLILFIVALALGNQSYAQITMTSGGSSSVSTATTFYEPGGTSNYTNNLNVTHIICPSTAGQYVTVSFSAFNTENTFDYLRVYNGSVVCTNSLLGSYTGTTIPGALTSSAPDGCLTFVFTSDVSTVAAGFTATLNQQTTIGGTAYNACPPPPANDNCAGAISMTVNPNGSCASTVTANTVNATNSNVTPTGVCTTNSGTPDDDIWYSFVAPTTAVILQGTFVSGNSDVYYQVFSSVCGSSMVSVLCTDTNTGGTLTGLTVGNTYYIRFYTYGSAVTSSYTLCLQQPPPNDNCAGAISMTVNPNGSCASSVTANTAATTNSGVTPTGTCTTNSGTPDDDIWYSFVAPTTTVVLQGTFISGVTDVYYQVFSSVCGSSMTSILCTDTDTGGTLTGLTVGNTYYIRFYTFGSAVTSSYTLCLQQPPPNDNCAGAISMTVNPAGSCASSVTASTAGATNSGVTPTGVCTTNSGTPDDDIWYSFVAPTTTVTLQGTFISGNSDVYYQVFSSVCGSSMVSVLCTDNNTGGLLTNLTVGNTYYIRFYTFGSAVTSSYTLCLQQPPPNDNCAGAIGMTVNPNGSCASTVTASTAAATNSSVTPTGSCTTNSGTPDDDIWYSFVAPTTSVILQGTFISGNSDVYYQVFSSVCGSSMVSVLCTDTNTGGTITGLTVGNTYYIRFYTFGSAVTSSYTLCLQQPPPPMPGKDCLAATPICCGQTVPSPTAGAGNYNEAIPNDCGVSEHNSTWVAISISAAGTLSMNFDATPDADIDFAAWLIDGTAASPATLATGCATLTNTGTNDRCDYNGSTLESGFGQGCIDNDPGTGNAGCDTEGALAVTPGDLVIVMVDDYGAFDGFAFIAETTLNGGATSICPPPVVTVVNATCSNACGAGTGAALGGSITISNCASTATLTEYATSATATIWTPGVPPYALYTGASGASPMFVRCNDATGTCPSQPAPVTTNPPTCTACPCTPPATPAVTVTNSVCSTGCTPDGGTFNIVACPTGSTLQVFPTAGATTGGSTTMPVYDQDGPAQTVYFRCVTNIDPTCVSSAQTVTTTPGSCTNPDAPLITVTNSSCNASCQMADGSFTTATACINSTLTYYTDNTGNTTTSAPVYDQDGPAQTVYYACLDVNGCRSAIQTVTTAPGSCPGPAAPVITVTNSVCSTGCVPAGGSFATTTACVSSTLTYYTDNTGSTTIPAPVYDQDGPAQIIYYACVDDVTGCRSPVQDVTTMPGVCTPPAVPVITVTNSVCSAGCAPAGGSFATTTACVSSTLTYYTDNTGSTTIPAPVYDQDGPAQTVYYACLDANGCRSAIQTVATAPGVCTPPAAPSTTGYAICPNGTIPTGQGLTAMPAGVTNGTVSASGSGGQSGTIGTTSSNDAYPGVPIVINFPAQGATGGLPTGAVVTGVTINITYATANGSYRDELLTRITPPAGYNAQVTNIQPKSVTNVSPPSSSGTFTGLLDPNSNPTTAPAWPSANPAGTWTFDFIETYNDSGTLPDANISNITINVSYMIIPAGTISWWDAQTGGTQLGTGSPFAPSPTPTSPTSYYAMFTDANGCVSPRTEAMLTVNPAPTFTTTPSNMAVCVGSSVNPTDVVANPSTGVTYNWSNDNTAIGLGASGTGQVSTFTAANSGTTPITATITYGVTITATGCTATSSFTVTVEPLPAPPTVTSPITICQGDVLPNIVPSGVGTLFNLYSNVSTATTTTSTKLNASPLSQFTAADLTGFDANTVGSYSYIVREVSAIGCEGAGTPFTVIVNPDLTAPTTTGESICEGNTPTGLTASCSNITQYGSTVVCVAIGGTFTAEPGLNYTLDFSAIPAGATVTGITYEASSGSTTDWRSEIDFNLSSPTLVDGLNLDYGDIYCVSPTCNSAGAWAFPAASSAVFNGSTASGNWNVEWHDDNTPNGNTLNSNSDFCLTVNWQLLGGTVPDVTWYDAPTGGNIVGTGSSFIPTDTAPGSYSYYAECGSSGAANCPSARTEAIFTINPLPDVDPITPVIVCNNESTTDIVFSGSLTGTTYNWTNDNTTIGLAASGTGDIAAFTATNTGTTPQVATITVTPSTSDCPGAVQTFTITVNPTPTVDDPADQIVCNGISTTAVSFAGSVAGTTYSWTNDNTTIGLAASGMGDIDAFTATNTGTVPQMATITVTPSASDCPGVSQTFTITVNPTPTVDDPSDQAVCHGSSTTAISFVGTVTGTTYSWTNDNATIGLAASGTGDIAAFAATNTDTAPQTATITVTPSANGCPGVPQTFTITVNPNPGVAVIESQELCNGGMTTAVVFSSAIAGTTYSWTNDNTTIGLAASGMGDIAAFTATNTGIAPQTATIIVTPSASDCPGAVQTFTITVNPTPTVDDPADQTVCNGISTTAVSFVGTVTGTTYAWTNNNTTIGLAASGTGDIAAFTATNTGTAPQTATVTVTPSANGCPGTSQTFVITVNPTPTVNDPADQTVCNGASTTAVNFVGTVTGTTYTWTNSNTTIGLAASGTGNNIAAFTATNAGTVPQTATITVTPSANSCPGASQTFTITVNPTPTVTNPGLQVICAGNLLNIPFSGALTSTTYNWTNSNTGIGLASSGTGNISFTAINPTATTRTSTITVTPLANGCPGASQTFTINVYPSNVSGTTSVNPANCQVTVIPNSSAYTVTFSSNDVSGGIRTGTLTSPFVFNPNASYAYNGAATTGTVTFTITNPAAPVGLLCGSVTLSPVTYSCCAANAGAVSVVDKTLCAGDPISVNASGYVGSATNPSPAGSTYNYYLVLINSANNTIAAVSPANPTLPYNFATASLTIGSSYVAYGYSVRVAPGTAGTPNPPVVGQLLSTLNDNTTICRDLSASSGTPVVVPPPISLLTTIFNTNEGNVGGLTPSYYNTDVFTIVGGTPPYSYTWSSTGYVRHSVIGTAPMPNPSVTIRVIYADNATWSVTVTDANNCTSQQVVVSNINQVNDPLLDITSYTIAPDLLTLGGQGAVNITASGGGCTSSQLQYLWSNGATTEDISGLLSGWYSVTVTCPLSGQTTQGWYWVPQSTGTSTGVRGKLDGNVDFVVVPNPLNSEATINFALSETDDAVLAIYGADGKQLVELYRGIVEGGVEQKLVWSADNLPAGIYLARLATAKGIVSTQQIVVVH